MARGRPRRRRLRVPLGRHRARRRSRAAAASCIAAGTAPPASSTTRSPVSPRTSTPARRRCPRWRPARRGRRGATTLAPPYEPRAIFAAARARRRGRARGRPRGRAPDRAPRRSRSPRSPTSGWSCSAAASARTATCCSSRSARCSRSWLPYPPQRRGLEPRRGCRADGALAIGLDAAQDNVFANRRGAAASLSHSLRTKLARRCGSRSPPPTGASRAMADDATTKDETARTSKGAPAPETPPPPHFEEEVAETRPRGHDRPGPRIAYSATAGRMLLRRRKGKKKASFFYVAYTRDGTTTPSARPIVFCFNGGPGSSSVWLHLGAFGPRRVDMTDDGHAVPAARPSSSTTATRCSTSPTSSSSTRSAPASRAPSQARRRSSSTTSRGTSRRSASSSAST